MSNAIDDFLKAAEMLKQMKPKKAYPGSVENPYFITEPLFQMAKKENMIEDEMPSMRLIKIMGMWWRIPPTGRFYTQLEIPSEEERRKWREEQRQMLELWKVD